MSKIYDEVKNTDEYRQGFKAGKRKQKVISALVCIPLIIFAVILGAMITSDDQSSVAPQSVESNAEQTEQNKLSEKEYKKSCKAFDFKDVSRNPNKYKGDLCKVFGSVLQVQDVDSNDDGDKLIELRVRVLENQNDYSDNVIYSTYILINNEDRILVDDMITIYGECAGEETYETVLGDSVTLPYIEAKYIEIE